ncbi:MAG TPA: hypothetical protein VM344_01245 [Vitreimonas sp.]|nr:hypothetical protein [Vitreimonas sp.]
MPKPSTDPLAATDRLLVDGSNLLHAMRRHDRGTLGDEAPPPAAALIGRLRAAIPPNIGIELVLDGPSDRGMHNQRIASGLIVRYSGRRSADDVLLALVDDVGRSAGPGIRERRAVVDNLLVVTDDRDLRLALQNRGVRSAGSRWLIGRLDRRVSSSPTTGNRRPPARPPEQTDEDERAGWRPGRGATTKRGNPKRRRQQPSG